MGKHLLVNAKALVFGGLFFAGEEAEAWMNLGLSVLAWEIPEPILPDGGHFELSPMYHALILEDLIDLINLSAAYPDAIPAFRRSFVSGWPAIVQKMRGWLAAMCHPDGEIACFNDAAIGIAPAPAELENYSDRLGLPPISQPASGLDELAESGYIRLQNKAAAVLLDVAQVGPDYQPGHAHADTLSFELSIFGQRILRFIRSQRCTNSSVMPVGIRQAATIV